MNLYWSTVEAQWGYSKWAGRGWPCSSIAEAQLRDVNFTSSPELRPQWLSARGPRPNGIFYIYYIYMICELTWPLREQRKRQWKGKVALGSDHLSLMLQWAFSIWWMSRRDWKSCWVLEKCMMAVCPRQQEPVFDDHSWTWWIWSFDYKIM